jgi:hypothetical protein
MEALATITTVSIMLAVTTAFLCMAYLCVGFTMKLVRKMTNRE